MVVEFIWSGGLTQRILMGHISSIYFYLKSGNFCPHIYKTDFNAKSNLYFGLSFLLQKLMNDLLDTLF